VTFQIAPSPIRKRPYFALEIQFLATKKVLRRKYNVNAAVAGDAETIGKNLGSSKGPTGATI
jgi:hypothetical protein